MLRHARSAVRRLIPFGIEAGVVIAAADVASVCALSSVAAKEFISCNGSGPGHRGVILKDRKRFVNEGETLLVSETAMGVGHCDCPCLGSRVIARAILLQGSCRAIRDQSRFLLLRLGLSRPSESGECVQIFPNPPQHSVAGSAITSAVAARWLRAPSVPSRIFGGLRDQRASAFLRTFDPRPTASPSIQ